MSANDIAMKRFFSFPILLIIILSFFSCASSESEVVQANMPDDDIVNIITNAMDFVVEDTLPAGWHTFRYQNRSQDPHFFLLEKMPDGKTIENYKQEVIPPFQNGMNMITKGDGEGAAAEFAKLPEWYGGVKFYGGSGILSRSNTSQTTVHLEPGYYLIECYMKMTGGIFHSSVGMLKSLVVTESSVDAKEPDIAVDYQIKVSSVVDTNTLEMEGFVLPETIRSGDRTFEVYFRDQLVHENFLGHDINLAHLSDSADIEKLEAWMNWANPDGLLGNPPEGVTFLGGMNNLEPGGKGFFTASLEAGEKYAFVAEVPFSMKKNMLKVFTVAE